MRKEVIHEAKWTGNVVDLNVVPVAALIRSMSRTADMSYARTARMECPPDPVITLTWLAYTADGAQCLLWTPVAEIRELASIAEEVRAFFVQHGICRYGVINESWIGDNRDEVVLIYVEDVSDKVLGIRRIIRSEAQDTIDSLEDQHTSDQKVHTHH